MFKKNKKENIKDKAKKVINEVESKIKKNDKKVLNSAKKTFDFVLSKTQNLCIKNLTLGCVKISINKHGMNIVYVFIGVAFLSLLGTGLSFLTATLISLLLLTIWFFRDPERVLPDRKNVVVAPCDGLIVKIETTTLPEELNCNDTKEYTKISTFMNITDMHVQRIPVDGKIKQIEYIKGLFVNASLDKASKNNERNYVLMEANNGDTICITQIAGFVARRIVCDVKQDEICKAGERYGCIKFGSRIELYVPKSYKIEVLTGQRMVCGETIVASWK